MTEIYQEILGWLLVAMAVAAVLVFWWALHVDDKKDQRKYGKKGRSND